MRAAAEAVDARSGATGSVCKLGCLPHQERSISISETTKDFTAPVDAFQEPAGRKIFYKVELLTVKQLEVSFAGHPSCSQVVLDNENGNRCVFRNHNRTWYTRLGKNHVITFDPHAVEPIGFENFGELFV